MNEKPIVFYNGACPLCRREIHHYRRIDAQRNSALDFVDIETSGRQLQDLDLEPDRLRRRLHVLDTNGSILSGLPAFAAVWDRLPPYRWLAWASRLPLLRAVLPFLYEMIASGLYRWDRRRRSRRIDMSPESH